jgi:Tol biopolymer transport system component
MTGTDRLNAGLIAYFDDVAAAPAPADLIERVTQATAPRRPRARWLANLRNGTVVEVAGRSRSGAQLLRVAALAVLTIALLIAAVAAVVAVLSKVPRPLPPPFGPAANGAIVFSIGNDLYLGDLETGSRHLLAAGVGLHPAISRDGGRIATTRFFTHGTRDLLAPESLAPCHEFHRQNACDVEVVISAVDGNRVATLTKVPSGSFVVAWSPDGSTLLLYGQAPFPANSYLDMYLQPIDGSSATSIARLNRAWLGGSGTAPIWRSRFDEARDATLLEPVDLLGNPAGASFEIPGGTGNDAVQISPDGSRIAVGSMYTSPDGPPPGEVEHAAGQLLLLRTDGTVERVVPLDTGVEALEFSPDGRRLVLDLTDTVDWSTVVIPADGTWTPIELGGGAQVFGCRWSPDGSALACQGPGDRIVLADPETGAIRETPWSSETLLSIEWQRLALP